MAGSRQEPVKAPYRTPRLTVFGKVGEITLGGGGSKLDIGGAFSKLH